ncbi:hypothetical protein FACS189468_3630 [Spirochaetia bacterium]|nr:hypothetical protein FACS189468_3630 [Spirochaetia bacterium]
MLIRGASQDFSGADMLPADMYFFGAAEPHPVSFDYLEELLRHINLVGRPCGVFSSGSREALDYLSEMVRDSELALYPEPLLAGPSAKPAEITAWVAKVVKGCP